ncbi:hypothetical protein [Paraburkholderia caribensis]|jgi:hypothetical protein|uniref:hypothetical protein n=1 Tax=Paraburkholderia caribensis TaxID=75105 RepID=UPI000AAE62B7|nr:hypothetical protein [Paraburkholderia caribensis]
MDMQELVSEFLASEHGSQATQALADQGINADDAPQMLGQVAETAHAHVEEQGAGLLGEHPGKSFFAAFAAGLVKGDPPLLDIRGTCRMARRPRFLLLGSVRLAHEDSNPFDV